MQCVILAAGKGTRLLPLTESTPKPLVPVCGKPILDHILEALPAEITEVILVTNYLEDQIKARYGAKWGDLAFKYVTQHNPSGGTGDALMCTKGLITGTFLVLNGDDIHGKAALATAIRYENALISVRTDTPKLFGVIDLNKDGTLRAITEKPENPATNLVNTGGFVAQPTLLDCMVEVSKSGELYATDMLTLHAQLNPTTVVEQHQWIPIGSLEQLAHAESILCGVDVDSADEI